MELTIKIENETKLNKKLNHNQSPYIKDTTMKKLTLIVALVVLIAAMAFSQTQTVNITVGAVQKLAVTGTPALTIGDAQATAGSDDLAGVSDNTSRYSLTHNGASAVKITAGIDAAFSLGSSILSVNLTATAPAVSAGDVNISNAITGTSDVEVISGIVRGAVASNMITYGLSGVKASDGQFTGTRTVTFTITN